MSLYNSGDGLQQNGLAQNNLAGGPVGGDMGMLDQTGGGIMNNIAGLDMDMGLPMDLDLDLAQTDPQAFAPMNTAQANNPAQQSQNQALANATGSSTDNTYNAMQQQAQAEAQMTGAGAGPLPTGFGMSAQTTSSTLTEFTKRRNWSQRIIEELKDFLHILTPDGRILYVSPSCRGITGYEPQSLIGKFIGEYVHPDDSGIFMREFNESIASGNSLRFFYRFKKDDGTYMIFECDGHPHISPEPQAQNFGPPQQNGMAVAGLCRGFFMMARPYPTKNAALLDSFLEHKIENERLMKRIDELKREEREENAEADRLYREQISQPSYRDSSQNPNNNTNSSESPVHNNQNSTSPPASSATPNYQGMPPPAKPTLSSTLLTRQNLDSALSSTKPDSIADKMSRYEATSTTHLESIELLTGLRYRDGERSHGISTGDTSPALIRGDAGIAILLDRERDGEGRKGKKGRGLEGGKGRLEEFVCADCGTLDSPEWRKGPKGPKTLCNACGLRWAKKEKKVGRPGEEGKDGSPHDGGGQGFGGGGGGGSGGLGGLSGLGGQVPGLLHHASTGS